MLLKQRQLAVRALLEALHQYRHTTDPQERQRISDAMTFSDPYIWVAYKREAYRGSEHELRTIEDFRTHCNHPGDICEKRFRFLSSRLDWNVWDAPTPLETILEDEDFLRVADDPALIKTWQTHEYHAVDGRVAKWEDWS